ncbi:hypothetical protein NC651_040416 [Populus alba x Populus x berolinensis]|nr:hypothetical protein NC651_040416 [Populus alba x Populus x berolinensis]
MDKYGKKYVKSNYLGREKSTLIQRILNISAGNLIRSRPIKRMPNCSTKVEKTMMVEPQYDEAIVWYREVKQLGNELLSTLNHLE